MIKIMMDYTKEQAVVKTDTLKYIAGCMQFSIRDKSYKIKKTKKATTS